MDLAVFSTDSVPRFGVFHHWTFVFLRLGQTRRFGDPLGLLDGLDLAPFVAAAGLGLHIFRETIGKAVQVRYAPFGIAGAALSGDHDEAKRDGFPDRGADRMPVYAVLLEIVVGNGKLAVIGAAMMRVLDLDAIEDAQSG